MTGTTLLFVHGTGVRGVDYAKSIESIRRQVARRNWAVEVEGCYWGGTPGATLEITGASVPRYLYSGGGEPSVADRETARWAVLYTDPWYELRLLTSFPADGGLGETARGRRPSGQDCRSAHRCRSRGTACCRKPQHPLCGGFARPLLCQPNSGMH